LREEIETLQLWLTTYHIVVQDPARQPADRAAEDKLDQLFRRFLVVHQTHRRAETMVEGASARWGMSSASPDTP
jgi:hypothetical protein